MSRITITLPEKFHFSTIIPLRITDLNYGNHVGNDTVLSIIHEARMQYLKSLGYTELDLAGVGLIMSEVAIQYKAELFYGDELRVWVGSGDFTRAGFNLYYKLEKAGSAIVAAKAQTGMVCFDYSARKIVRLPDDVKARLGV